MPALIGPIGSVVNMNQAVNGNAAGNPVYISQLNVAESAALGGVSALIASYNSQLASSASAALATTVLNNMFVTTAAGVPAANVTALTAALTQAFDTYPTAKGQVISNLSTLLGNLESDANWGPAARAFNNQAASNYTYSINPANTSSGTPSATTSTFTLTTNADGPGAVAPAINTTGTSGVDTYNGTIAAAAANGDSGTLNSYDNLAGGTGVDTLVARITALGGATTITPTMSSIDTVLVGNTDTSTNLGTLNLVSATGTTTVGFSNTVAASVTNIINASTTAAIVLDNADATANQLVNLGSNAGRSGTADAFSLTVQNGTGSSTSVANFGLITAAAAADTSFEVMNITVGAGASNFLTFGTGGANISTINVSGAGTPSTAQTTAGQVLVLTEAANFANVTTINAAGLTTGGLNVSTTSALNTTFTGSGFNDRLNITAGVGNLTGSDSINFGAGTLDTLAFGTTVDFRAATLGGATTALINAITTADNLEATTAGAIQIRMADWTTVNTFTLSGATGAGGAVASTNNATITGLETADTLRVTADIRTIGAAGASGATGGANAGTAGTAGVDNILLGGQAVGQTASLVFTGGVDLVANGGAGGNGGTGSNAGVAGAGAAGGAGASAIDVANGGANVTTLNIASLGTSANTLTGGSGGAGGSGGSSAGNGTGGAAGAGGNAAAAIDNGAGLSQVNITGNADLTIAGGTGGAAGAAGTSGGANGATAAAGTNSGGFSSAVNVNASTFTGVLTITGSSAADAITGGTNNDIITTFGGLDTLTGGAGTDNFRINGSAATTATAYVTIRDFASGDTISVLSQVAAAGALNGTASFNTTAVSVSTATTLAGALDLAAAGTGGGTNSVVRYFNWTDGNTYLVVDNSNNATLQAGDGVIQLIGTVTLTVGSVNFA